MTVFLWVPSSGLHCSSADSVELAPAAVLLHWNPPEGEHGTFPGQCSFHHQLLLKLGFKNRSAALNSPFFLPLFVQFFTDVKEAEEKLKKMQDTMKRKYTCDRSITVTRLEDLLQDAAVSWTVSPWTFSVLKNLSSTSNVANWLT